MTPDEDRIARLYSAFNDRAFERCVAMMARDVVWPDELEDRPLYGADAVLAYLVDNAASLRVHYEPISLHSPTPGKVEVLTRQNVTSLADGSLWSSTRVLHRFTLSDGLITRLESQQAYPDPTFPGVDRLLARLHSAVNTQDIEAAVACYAPDTDFLDPLEGGRVRGEAALRAHFRHLFDTIRMSVFLLDYALDPDDRVRVRMRVEMRGKDGGLWQDGAVTAWYRLHTGLIVEQDVDDSGEETR